MIVSASRRTDIPSFYSDWFLNRLKEGYALIPNPRNPQRLGRVELSPHSVDCIVFWTKNPGPMLPKFDIIKNLGYKCIVQFTLTPYGNSIECGLPPKAQLLEIFMELAKKMGRQCLVWRYDPVIVDHRFSIQWHLDCFSRMCERLHPYTHRCIISFIDCYKSIEKRFRPTTTDAVAAIADGFSCIAQKYGLGLFTCAEEADLDRYGIAHGACIDKSHLEQVIGFPLEAKADPNQRAACLCAEAVDIGAYNTCTHGCAYCYAVSSAKTAARYWKGHDPFAPMITGYPVGDEVVTLRTARSHKVNQLLLL